jgi:hypothetical protein
MARTKQARRKTNRPTRKVKAATRKTARKRAKPARRPKAAARKATRKTSRKVARKAKARRPVRKAAARKTPRKTIARSRTRRTASSAARGASKPKAAKTTRAAQPGPPREGPILNRIRRLLAEEERMGVAAAALQGDHLSASAVSGRGALRAELSKHTESSPILTAGDLDAKWQDAYAVGDEAPGGDNPTPDQDRVDDIGKALGIEYQDGEELKGGEEVLERDRHRWEMDPASSDDWPHNKK